MTTSSVISLVTIILYLCFVVLVGLYIGSKTKKSAEGFFLGGRGLGPLVTAMSAEASDMSSYLLMGIPGLAYLTGLSDAMWTAIGLGIGTYLNFLLVAKRLRVYSEKINAITIPDFISKRYKEKTPIILGVSALVIIIFFIPYVASGLVAIGKLFNTFLGWPYMTAVLVGALVIASYSVTGGFGSVATMDLIQACFMTFGLTVIIIFATDKAGGFNAAIENAKAVPGFFSPFEIHDPVTGGSNPYTFINIISTMAWGLGYFGMPHILVRFMAIRDKNEITLSRRIASVWVFISMGVAILIGIIGMSVSKNGVIPVLIGNDSERLIVYLSNVLAQNGLFFAMVSGIILAGILAATMSTADSQLLCAASSFSENILQGVLKIKIDDKKTLVAARVTILVMIIIAILFAKNPDSNIFGIVSFAWAGFGATFGPAILLSLYWKRSNYQGIAAGIIAGAITIFIWKFIVRPMGGALNIYELLPAFLVNLIVSFVISNATKEPSKEIQDEFESVIKSI